MIANDEELRITLERIAWFQLQAAKGNKTETNAVNRRASASGFLAEMERMQSEVCEYLNGEPATVGDDLTNALLEGNSDFQAMVAKSAASGRQPFEPSARATPE